MDLVKENKKARKLWNQSRQRAGQISQLAKATEEGESCAHQYQYQMFIAHDEYKETLTIELAVSAYSAGFSSDRLI